MITWLSTQVRLTAKSPKIFDHLVGAKQDQRVLRELSEDEARIACPLCVPKIDSAILVIKATENGV